MSKQIDLVKLRSVAASYRHEVMVLNAGETIELLRHIERLEKDASRLDWMDKQVKDHVVYNGYTWQEAGYEDNRGLVCAIQGKKKRMSVRQAIDTAMEASNAKAD